MFTPIDVKCRPCRPFLDVSWNADVAADDDMADAEPIDADVAAMMLMRFLRWCEAISAVVTPIRWWVLGRLLLLSTLSAADDADYVCDISRFLYMHFSLIFRWCRWCGFITMYFSMLMWFSRRHFDAVIIVVVISLHFDVAAPLLPMAISWPAMCWLRPIFSAAISWFSIIAAIISRLFLRAISPPILRMKYYDADYWYCQLRLSPPYFDFRRDYFFIFFFMRISMITFIFRQAVDDVIDFHFFLRRHFGCMHWFHFADWLIISLHFISQDVRNISSLSIDYRECDVPFRFSFRRADEPPKYFDIFCSFTPSRPLMFLHYADADAYWCRCVFLFISLM